MPTQTISLAAAHDLVVAALTANRTSADNARAVAEALVTAEADGITGHGLSRVPSYAAQAKSGKVDGFATPTLSAPAPAALIVDAACGFAFPAIDVAIGALPDLCRTQGVAVAAIRRSHHCGAAGHHVERLARAGAAALFFANTPQGIAPWGGRRGLFGTNPIAFAAPRPGHDPVVVDLSLSKVARCWSRSRRARKFRQAGRSIATDSRPPIPTPPSPAPWCPWATPRARRSP